MMLKLKKIFYGVVDNLAIPLDKWVAQIGWLHLLMLVGLLFSTGFNIQKEMNSSEQVDLSDDLIMLKFIFLTIIILLLAGSVYIAFVKLIGGFGIAGLLLLVGLISNNTMLLKIHGVILILTCILSLIKWWRE